jgi:hypothetical protein
MLLLLEHSSWHNMVVAKLLCYYQRIMHLKTLLCTQKCIQCHFLAPLPYPLLGIVAPSMIWHMYYFGFH